MEFLPINVRITALPCLLVGGGGVATRKAKLLAQAGAQVCICAPDIEPELQALVDKTQGQVWLQPYNSNLINRSFRLVIAATNNPAVNAQVYHDCSAIGVLVNSVDDPDNSGFIMPAIIDRSPLIVSVSSGGSSPVLATRVRGQIEAMLPAATGKLASVANLMRGAVKAKFGNVTARRIFWQWWYDSPAVDEVYRATESLADIAKTMQDTYLTQYVDNSATGFVALVGAGPGDPDLLTFAAQRQMQLAEVVVYDRLVSPAILERCRRDAEFVYVGKANKEHTMRQEDINELLLSLAQQGKRVCRLKGGDPFIFGRGGEELMPLAEANIPFIVVPAVTAAIGCASYAGIPLTHRDYAQSVRFITGHLKDDTLVLPWQELIYEQQTLVIYMGLITLSQLVEQLTAHGLRSNMPVAIVSKGTLPDQQILIGTLATIVQQVALKQPAAPTIIIIGEVVKLHNKLYAKGNKGV